MRASNTVLGLVNFATFLLSFPILAGGIWLSAKANQADCMRFLQWPFLALGLFILVISLMGFAGACYRISWLLWLYLFAMFLVIATLFALVVFAFAVTSKGAGRPVINRSYLDFYLSDYSGWLKDRVSDEDYWAKISSCLREARICRKIGRSVGGLPESPDLFYLRHLSPIQVCGQFSKWMALFFWFLVCLFIYICLKFPVLDLVEPNGKCSGKWKHIVSHLNRWFQ